MNGTHAGYPPKLTPARDRSLLEAARLEHWPAAVFFLVSLLIFYFVSNRVFNPDLGKWEFVYPSVFSGDEPHYLIMISSMLFDGDLSLANNYQSVRMGGSDAGQKFRGAKDLDHHTLIKDLRTGQSALWEQVFEFLSPVECVPSDASCIGFKRLNGQFPDFTPANPNYVELPKHPTPFPAALATLPLILRTPRDAVEVHSIYLIVLLSWLTGIATYFCALHLGLGPKGSLAVVSLLFFASPWLPYSHSMVPATFMGLLLVVALWAFLSEWYALSAALLAIAAMQSEAFVLIFPAWTLQLYVSKERKYAYRFAAATGVAIAAVSLINYFFLGHITIRDMNMSLVSNPLLIWRTFIDPNTGVLLFLPWSVPVFCFLAISFFLREKAGAQALRLIAGGVFPVAGVYMILPYTGQYCYGPRYWVPYFPWLALALVLSLKIYKSIYPRFVRPALIALVVLSVVIVATASILPPERVWREPPWRALAVLLESVRRSIIAWLSARI